MTTINFMPEEITEILAFSTGGFFILLLIATILLMLIFYMPKKNIKR